jgi:hypothetical protein
MSKHKVQELLKAIAGSYQPGFMQIKLTHQFKYGFGDFTLPQLGVFLHEYIHYLQNISTPWGLYMSMVQYRTIAETYAYIQSSVDVIELPFNISTPELDHQWKIINLGKGHYPFNHEYEYKCQVIDRSKKIIIHRTKEQIGEKKYPKISLDITFADGSLRTIDLGALIINESMAAMYQMIIDPNATHENNDFPYNLIKILCEQYYPNIADDINKLISICYISLFSMSPSEILLDQMNNASENPDVPGVELFNEFIRNSKIYDNRGKESNITEFMDDLIDGFKSILTKLLNCELDYIADILDKVRISNQLIPLLKIIHEGELNPKIVEEMISVLDIPFTYNDKGEHFLPKSVKEPSKNSDDMLVLIANSALYNYIAYPNEYRCCPLKFMCMQSNPKIEKYECFDFPWLGKDCPITGLCEYIGLKNKSFKWKY